MRGMTLATSTRGQLVAGRDPYPTVLAFFRTQGVLSDPRSAVDRFSDLPRTPSEIARVVQGLLVPPYPRLLAMYGLKEGDFDNSRFGVRRAEDLLRRIERRHPGPLTIPRPPKDRIGAICRNFTFLQVSMLRHQGIPARSRVGFSGYLDAEGATWWDHRVTEYWDGGQHRWVLYDCWIDEVRRNHDRITLDTTDLRPTGKFLLAPEAWRLTRQGGRDPNTFGDSPSDRGMPPIRYALLQDLAYLNKVELLGNDDWGELLTKPEAHLTNADRAFLDEVAAATVEPDANFEEVRRLFGESPYGRAVMEAIEGLEAGASRS